MCACLGAPGSGRLLLAKLLLDNLIFTPLYVAAYLAYGSAVINRRGHEVRGKLCTDYLPTLGAELCLWPPFMALVFQRVPVQHQLLAVNLFSLFDVAFLSWVRENGHVLDEIKAMPLFLLGNQALSSVMDAAFGEEDMSEGAAGCSSDESEQHRSWQLAGK